MLLLLLALFDGFLGKRRVFEAQLPGITPSHYEGGGNTLRRTRLVLAISIAMAVTSIALALPVGAQGLGPSVACDAGTFDNCTDSAVLGSSKETFACEGSERGTATCTNRRSSETYPYCVFLGHEPAEGRDMYLCGPDPNSH